MNIKSINNLEFKTEGKLPCVNDSSIDSSLSSWKKLQALLYQSINSGRCFSSDIISTYSLVYTTSSSYSGGVLAPNGDIHFIPCYATVGQKISSSGVVSTYSLVYTTITAFSGGVLTPNGDIHFIPYGAVVGQKISLSGVVSTYSLINTTAPVAATSGILDKNGNIIILHGGATRLYKISTFPTKPWSQICCHSFFNKY